MFKTALNFERSITINKPISEVFAYVADLNNWSKWSPWVHIEPSASLVSGGSSRQVGQWQTWDGSVIGAGKMTIATILKDQLVGLDLEFFKPWKSHSSIEFKFSSSGQGTQVTWKMNSSLPIFMIFIKKMMISFMSSDFDRGLRMLSEVLETGAVCSTSKFSGTKTKSGFYFVGIKSECKIADLGTSVHRDFSTLLKYIQSGKLPQPQSSITFTHKYDVIAGICSYTAAMTYANPMTTALPDGVITGQVPKHNSLIVDHFGSYKNLGNAWATAMSYQRVKKEKSNKAITFYEEYISMPGSVPEKELHTQINIPVI